MKTMDNKLQNHLSALAKLRNIAARKGQIAAAVSAEVARGRAMGFHKEQAGDSASRQELFIETYSRLLESLPG